MFHSSLAPFLWDFCFSLHGCLRKGQSSSSFSLNVIRVEGLEDFLVSLVFGNTFLLTLHFVNFFFLD